MLPHRNRNELDDVPSYACAIPNWMRSFALLRMTGDRSSFNIEHRAFGFAPADIFR